jgi:hypothetical protein
MMERRNLKVSNIKKIVDNRRRRRGNVEYIFHKKIN